MVSIITSTYSRSERLKKAIESVINQTYDDWELIIVDDASKDDTEKVVKSFKDKRISYIKRTKNYGCDTRPKNRGIKASKGEYIAFLDDDNRYRPDHLAVLVKEIERTEADVVYGDRWVVDETGEISPRMAGGAEFEPFRLMRENFIDTSDVLIRRDALFEVGGFDERYRKYVDWNLWVRLVKAGKKFKHVNAILTDYVLHSDSQKSTRQEDERGHMIPAWDAFDLEVQLPHLGSIEEPRVAIFSLTYDRLEYTEKCFESLYSSAGYDFDHYIVDNGSRDGTTKYLKKLQKKYPDRVYIIENAGNVGISKASNQALELIGNGYQIIGKVDNDCLFLTEGWLAKMVDIWKSNRLIALSCYVQGLKDNPGGAPRETYGVIKDELIGMTRHLGGICVFSDAKAYDGFRWDEQSFLHGVQDVEFSQHIGFKGYQMGYMENFFCEHIDGTEGQHKRYPEYFERRKKEKTTRYGK